MSSVQGLVDVFGGGAREFGNGLAIHWRGIGEVLTFDRRDELAADVVTVAVLEGYEGAGGARMGVDHDESLLLFLVVAVRRTATVT
ncbi:hypothetical protein D3C86_898580 [compost metagenome]